MKRLLWLLLICILGVACRKGLPSDIIEPIKMEKVLYDIHIVDGYLSNIGSNDSAKKVGASYYDGIYKKFDIDSATYNTSLNYYYSQPDLLESIYKNIQTKINFKNAGMRKVDSLNNAKINRVAILKTEKQLDSMAINVGYSLASSKNILFLPRYNDRFSENFIQFDFRKLKKDFDYAASSGIYEGKNLVPNKPLPNANVPVAPTEVKPTEVNPQKALQPVEEKIAKPL